MNVSDFDLNNIVFVSPACPYCEDFMKPHKEKLLDCGYEIVSLYQSVTIAMSVMLRAFKVHTLPAVHVGTSMYYGEMAFLWAESLQCGDVESRSSSMEDVSVKLAFGKYDLAFGKNK